MSTAKRSRVCLAPQQQQTDDDGASTSGVKDSAADNSLAADRSRQPKSSRRWPTDAAAKSKQPFLHDPAQFIVGMRSITRDFITSVNVKSEAWVGSELDAMNSGLALTRARRQRLQNSIQKLNSDYTRRLADYQSRSKELQRSIGGSRAQYNKARAAAQDAEERAVQARFDIDNLKAELAGAEREAAEQARQAEALKHSLAQRDAAARKQQLYTRLTGVVFDSSESASELNASATSDDVLESGGVLSGAVLSTTAANRHNPRVLPFSFDCSAHSTHYICEQLWDKVKQANAPPPSPEKSE